MTLIQRFFMSILPRSWAEEMRAESQEWKIRCCTCGAALSIWDAGGIRWKAYSKGKLRLIRCSKCGCVRKGEIVREK